MDDTSEFLKPDQYGDMQDVRVPEDARLAGPNQNRIKKEERDADPGLLRKVAGWATTRKDAPNSANDVKAREEEAQGLPSMSSIQDSAELQSILDDAAKTAVANGNSPDASPAPNFTPAPAPVPAMASALGAVKRSVPPPAPTMVMEPMDISASAPASAAAQSAPMPMASTANVPAPASAPAGPAAPGDEEQYAAAMRRTSDARKRARLGSALAGMFGASDAKQKAILESADGPVADLFQKQQFLAKSQQAKDAKTQADRQAALDDPNSAISKQAQMLAVATGLVKPLEAQNLTAAEWSMVKDGATLSDARQSRQDQLKLQRDEMASHEHEGALNRGSAVYLKKLDMAGDLQRAQLAAAVKGRAKELPAELLQADAGAGAGAQEYLNQADAFSKVGGLGQLGPDSAIYKKNREAGALKAAIGENPRARESLSAKTEGLADTYLPQPSDFRGTGMTKIANGLLRTHTGLHERIGAFRAAGYDSTPLEQEQQQVSNSVGQFLAKYGKDVSDDVRQKLTAASAGGGSGVVQTKSINGKQYSQLADGTWVEH